MFSGIGPSEIIIIILVLTVVFGSKKIGELANEAGRAAAELKKIKKEYTKAVEEVANQVNETKSEIKNADKSQEEVIEAKMSEGGEKNG